MSTDVSNQELEDLMAELEAQNATIAAAAPAIEEVVIEATPEPEPVAPAAVAEVNIHSEEFDSSDLDDLEALGLGDTLEPTPADKLNADQQTGLEEAFDEPTIVDVKVSEPEKVALNPADEVKAEPIEEVIPEQTPEPEPEPAPAVSAEPRKLNITPKPAETKPRSDKAIAETAELKFKPDLMAFQRETKITSATLDECMLDQSSLMAYHTAQHAQAEAQLSRVKQKFNILEAGLYDAYRKHFAKEGEKVTEKAVENAVRLDTKWAAAHLLLIEAQTYSDMHKGFVSSLHDRRAMLMQIGADRREEMKGQVRTVQQMNPESPANQQQRSDSNDMASRAAALARASLNRAA